MGKRFQTISWNWKLWSIKSWKFDICKDPCERAPRLKNLSFLFLIWRSVVDMILVQTYLFPIWWSCVSLRKKSTSNKNAFFVDDKSHQEKVQQTDKAFFCLKIRLTKKKDSFQQKKPLFVKDKFHQEKSQQTKKSLFSLMISLTKKKLNLKQKIPIFVKDKSHKEKLNFNTKN